MASNSWLIWLLVWIFWSILSNIFEILLQSSDIFIGNFPIASLVKAFLVPPTLDICNKYFFMY